MLVLDEPTAVLPAEEVTRLFAVVEEVRKSGTAVLYVSHRMDEIFISPTASPCSAEDAW